MEDKKIAIVLAEVVGGRRYVFGLEVKADGQTEIEDEVSAYMDSEWITPLSLQVLVQQQVFHCPFCKALNVVGCPQCANPACTGPAYNTQPAAEALSKIQVIPGMANRTWSAHQELSENTRFNTTTVIAWAVAADESPLRLAWKDECQAVEKMRAEIKAEASGLVLATEAQAKAMVQSKAQMDAAVKAGPNLKIVKP